MTTLHTQLYNAARYGNLEHVRALHLQGADISMAIMGAADGARDWCLTTWEKDDSHACLKYAWKIRACSEYAWENGAPFLFSIQQK